MLDDRLRYSDTGTPQQRTDVTHVAPLAHRLGMFHKVELHGMTMKRSLATGSKETGPVSLKEESIRWTIPAYPTTNGTTLARKSNGQSWKMCFLVILAAFIVGTSHVSHAFSTPLRLSRYAIPRPHCQGLQNLPGPQNAKRIHRSICHLVSEDDVVQAVEQAEEMWAEALEARKTANALSDRAEEEAEAAAATSEEIDTLFRTQKAQSEPITMTQLAAADAAARSNLDAGSMVNRALRAVEQAEKLEALAEEALQRSEEILEQHLSDFPDSPFAQ